ncbi:exosome complex component RRP43 [Planoprotostelium fungivorum]|uniref:Ribosomal RNA-processing protein 43 n=1 Tax=Planoprotostelium fungivorum TaxID=1890364 RepID=A0A2P6MZX7_9EUKA|nr:exosome complex component RRP43 [Planoprotostelium fungivorum]
MESFRKIYSSEFHKKFLAHNVRPDGRSLDDARNTKISVNSFGSSNGSAFVRIGNTHGSQKLGGGGGDGTSVTCAIVAEVGPPTDATPNGQIIVNVEMTPICSSRFRTGKPTEEAQALGHWLNELVRSPHHLSLEDMKVKMTRHEAVEDDEEEDSLPGMVWYLYADVYCINHDGSIGDAALIALFSAIQNVRLPQLVVTKENQMIAMPIDASSGRINILHHLVPTTFAIIDEQVLVDPSAEEEELSSGLLTIVTRSDGSLVTIRKSGGTSLDDEKLKQCMKTAAERCKTVEKEIKSQR